MICRRLQRGQVLGQVPAGREQGEVRRLELLVNAQSVITIIQAIALVHYMHVYGSRTPEPLLAFRCATQGAMWHIAWWTHHDHAPRTVPPTNTTASVYKRC